MKTAVCGQLLGLVLAVACSGKTDGSDETLGNGNGGGASRGAGQGAGAEVGGHAPCTGCSGASGGGVQETGAGGTAFGTTACKQPRGPLSTWHAPRPTSPWRLTRAEATNGAGGAAGGAPGDLDASAGAPDGAVGGSQADAPRPSGCVFSGGTPVSNSTTCRGGAWMKATPSGPELKLDDGSLFTWVAGTSPPVHEPFILEATGDRVWVEFVHRTDVWCPFCGSYETSTIEIRERDGGALRFIARQGARLEDLSESLVMALFGVPAVPRRVCGFRANAGCTDFDRSQFEHVLRTQPEQVIEHATLTRVLSPNGVYDVFWTGSTETGSTRLTNCNDGPGVASDNAFVASRVLP